MWYIENVYSRGHDTNDVAVMEPCVYSSPEFRADNDIFMTLRDSDTRMIMRLVGERGTWDKFDVNLMRFNPYGYIRRDSARYILVAIDELSLKFLDFVEDIKTVYPASNKEVQQMLWGYRASFWFWDSERSLVDCYSRYDSTRYAFPLFQIICFMQRGWLGDCFYLRATDGDAIEISFTNPRKARAFIAKAVTGKYNPIEKWKKVKEDLYVRQQ